MRYYIIAGEASGDLHASRLVRALRAADPEACLRGIGGDLMEAEGVALISHYRDLAYMGFVPVLLHARTILRHLARTKRDVAEWRPDVVVLVDYPGFNLKIARFVSREALCPVCYYIAPKIWAWKSWRIAAIRRDVTQLLSILPFEKDFFEGRHGYPITYVGNPTLDEVTEYLTETAESGRKAPLDGSKAFLSARKPSGKRIALLPGSRRQEIRDNLVRMLRAARPLAAEGYRLEVAAAPGIADDFYRSIARREGTFTVRRGDTYGLLLEADAALVVSGTATLEACLLGVPQVVCYYTRFGRLFSLLRRWLLKVPYVSLVNLVAGRAVVRELVCHEMNVAAVRRELLRILGDGAARAAVLEGYNEVRKRLGEPGAAFRAAEAVRRTAAAGGDWTK